MAGAAKKRKGIKEAVPDIFFYLGEKYFFDMLKKPSDARQSGVLTIFYTELGITNSPL
jgi:hypothetical protein